MATIYNTATTLDGFLATTDNSLDWLFEVPGADDAESSVSDFLAGIGVLAMGSTTYEWLLAHENMIEEPQKWQDWYADRPTWVFTHRDLPVIPGANITLTSDEINAVHAEMKVAAGERDIWIMGGGDLVGQFDDAGLLDRITATIAPVTLGAGAPFLPRDIRSDRLTLTSILQRGQFAEVSYDVAPKVTG